jgi:hypothetical protein
MKEALSSSETSVLTRATRRVTSQKTPFFTWISMQVENALWHNTGERDIDDMFACKVPSFIVG